MSPATSKLDEELIHALQLDGRASYSTLARRLGVPRNVVSSRVRALLEREDIRIFAAADPAFLGEQALAHVAITGKGEVSELIEELVAREDVPLVSATSGLCDLVAEVRAADHGSLRETILWIRGLPGVATLSVTLYTDVLRGVFASVYKGGSTVDDIDTRLIDLLSRDARTSYREMAMSVHLSQTAVRKRVERMLNSRMLKIGVVIRQDAENTRFKVGLGLNLSGDEQSVVEELSTYTEMEFMALTMGGFDLVATLNSSAPQELFSRLESLKSLSGVSRMLTWFHLRTFKEDYSRSISIGEV